MKEYVFNNLVKQSGECLIPYTHLIYQLLILIGLYYYFNQILSQISNQILITDQHFIILAIIFVLALSIDWYIWRSVNNTALFAAILVIFITYNLNRLNIISTFISNADNNLQATKHLAARQQIAPNDNTISPSIADFPFQDYFKDRLFNKKDMNNLEAPKPFDTELKINSNLLGNQLNEAYKPGSPQLSITDSEYANVMVTSLFDTPQIKNAHLEPECNSISGNLTEGFQGNCIGLMHETRTYNDTCSKCSGSSSCQLAHNLVNFGRALSDCTNQENCITPDQLDKIINNYITPLQIQM